jgi:membrane-bound lytic murein transglycosylase B
VRDEVRARGGVGGRPRRVASASLLFVAVTLLGCGAGKATTARETQGVVDSAVLAAAVDRAQAVIDDPSASAARLRKAARSEQLAFRTLASRRSLRRAVLARLSPGSRSAARAALHAAGALTRIVPPERHFPHWRILAPPPPSRLLGYFQSAAARFGVPWQYLAAIELVETRMGRIHGLSPAGARGPMQFMPATWAEYGHGSINSQRDSIMAAARLLAANGGGRSIRRALFHYNPSQSYVTAVDAYAREMRSDPRSFYGYYFWQVLYRTIKGTFLLPVGYPRVRPERVSVAAAIAS